MADYKKIKDDIANRAATDADFLAELKKDPKGTIEKYYPQDNGASIPDDLKIVVVEDSKDTVYINVTPETELKDGY